VSEVGFRLSGVWKGQSILASVDIESTPYAVMGGRERGYLLYEVDGEGSGRENKVAMLSGCGQVC